MWPEYEVGTVDGAITIGVGDWTPTVLVNAHAAVFVMNALAKTKTTIVRNTLVMTKPSPASQFDLEVVR